MKRFVVLALTLVAGAAAGAQTGSATPGDAVIERARQLVNQGRAEQGRDIIDSVLNVATPDSAIYAEALYWRGALAATAADAERDYRRLLIEAPLSARAEDAMLQLANLLQARGDRRGASEYLERFLLTYANSAARPRATVSLVRLLFEQGPQMQARACQALREGRQAVPMENLELHNQLEFYAPRCSMLVAEAPPAALSPRDIPSTPAPAPDLPAPEPSIVASTPTPDSTPSPPTLSATVSTAAAGATAYYSVQVAAYDSQEAADRLAKLLVDRGLEARVDGTARPFRVRVGKYATRADAVGAAAALKSHGHNGFITLIR